MMKVSLAAGALMLSGTFVVGCGSDGPDEPEPRSDKAAICSTVSLGDECVYQDGYCSAACNTCFMSTAERIRIQNLWACASDPSGGGGGSYDESGKSCSTCQSEYSTCEKKHWDCRELMFDCNDKFYQCIDKLPPNSCPMPGSFCKR